MKQQYETDVIRAGVAVGNSNARPATGAATSDIAATKYAAHLS